MDTFETIKFLTDLTDPNRWALPPKVKEAVETAIAILSKIEMDGTRCPECGAPFIECVGTDGEDTFDSFKCPNGCDLRGHYA